MRNVNKIINKLELNEIELLSLKHLLEYTIDNASEQDKSQRFSIYDIIVNINNRLDKIIDER